MVTPIDTQLAATRSPGRGGKAGAVGRLRSATTQLAEALAAPEVEIMAQETERAAAAVRDGRVRVSAVTGERLPDSAEMAEIRRANLQRAFNARRELLADALDAGEVAELLGVSRQTPHDRAKALTLLAIRDGGKLRFPDWQFDPDGPDGVLGGLPRVLRALDGATNALGRIRWFLTPQSLMDGRTPLDGLRQGEVDTVTAAAEALGAS